MVSTTLQSACLDCAASVPMLFPTHVPTFAAITLRVTAPSNGLSACGRAARLGPPFFHAAVTSHASNATSTRP